MSRDDLHFRLRLPAALKSEIEADAAANGRSMTAEIVARLSGTQASLRDQFAMSVVVDTDMASALAEELNGRPMPTHGGGQGGWRDASAWWAEAEAKFRYIKADAMLAAREGGAK